VSRYAGTRFCDRLLMLPACLIDGTGGASDADILSGLALTGHFLERDVLAPYGLAMPRARERLISLLGRAPAAARSA
jgi:DNA repair protein RecO (recombination protein O)